jgi:hypothetical protein
MAPFLGPELNVPRSRHSCAAMKWQNQTSGLIQTVIVAAGGATTNNVLLNSTELLFVDLQNLQELPNSEFIVGPDLPLPMQLGVMVGYESSVVYTAGKARNNSLTYNNLNLFQLSNPQGPWTLMNQMLKEARTLPVAFLVSDDVANTCA